MTRGVNIPQRFVGDLSQHRRGRVPVSEVGEVSDLLTSTIFDLIPSFS
jgi:hypothetical protein